MSSIGSTTSPVVPLSTLLDPTAASTGSGATGTATATTPVLPPALAGENGRGFSAISFGLTPPPPGGITEAVMVLIKQTLEDTRGEVRAHQAEASRQRAVTAQQQMAAGNASLESSLERATSLQFFGIPAALDAESEALSARTEARNAVIDKEAQREALVNDGIAPRETRLAEIGAEIEALESEEASLAARRPDAEGAERAEIDTRLAQIPGEISALEAERSQIDSELGALNATLRHIDYVELPALREAQTVAEVTYDEAEEERKRLERLLGEANLAIVEQLLLLPILALLVGVFPLGLGSLEQAEAALAEKEGEESTADVYTIIRSFSQTREEADILFDALEKETTDLDTVRIRQVGLAFGQIFTSLQQALTAMEDAFESTPRTPGDLASENETRVRLELAGRA